MQMRLFLFCGRPKQFTCDSAVSHCIQEDNTTMSSSSLYIINPPPIVMATEQVITIIKIQPKTTTYDNLQREQIQCVLRRQIERHRNISWMI